MTLEEDFEKATLVVRGIAGKLDSADLLFFYARFKQAKEGPNKTPKPRFFDFQGKQKWQAWTEMGETSSNDAMKQYIDKLDGVHGEDWREEEAPQEGAGWVRVSSLQSGEVELKDAEKILLDWVKEGNVKKTAEILESRDFDGDLNALDDEDGMAPLHWAADRGNADVIKILLNKGAKVDLRDSEGQTALHFAASCGHEDVIKILLNSGAEKDACDNDGLKPLDAVDGKSGIRELLQ